jgi:hypothetical protein
MRQSSGAAFDVAKKIALEYVSQAETADIGGIAVAV